MPVTLTGHSRRPRNGVVGGLLVLTLLVAWPTVQPLHATQSPGTPVSADGLTFSTYLGGLAFDEAVSVAIGPRGSAYVTGPASPGFPTTRGAHDRRVGGAGDAFVAKFEPSGDLVYSTVIGGRRFDEGRGIAVMDTGHVLVTGMTQSRDFPTTRGVRDRSFNGGGSDAFVLRLSPAGSHLGYSTLVGGSRQDVGNGIALGRHGAAYVTGFGDSRDFPTTRSAFDRSFGGGTFDGFVLKMNLDGSSLGYSTYVGGSSSDEGRGIAVDDRGRAYVAGFTQSLDFPATSDAWDAALGGEGDAFVLRLTRRGRLGYATYLGGGRFDTASPFQTIDVGPKGGAYVAGTTLSANFPTTDGAYATRRSGPSDAFVTKLSPSGSLAYSTFLGGASFDDGQGITIDGARRAVVGGVTVSENFPATATAFDDTLNGRRDALVSVVSRSGSRLVYSTYLGGPEPPDMEGNGDQGYGVGMDLAGDVVVVGGTDGADFPTTAGVIQESPGGGMDGFVTKLAL